jgi:hypothetical protein
VVTEEHQPSVVGFGCIGEQVKECVKVQEEVLWVA